MRPEHPALSDLARKWIDVHNALDDVRAVRKAAAKARAEATQAALAKLTPEEKRLLGLSDK